MASAIAKPFINPAGAITPALSITGCENHLTDALTGLPESFPEMLDGPMAWTGAQFVDHSNYIHTLSVSDLQETENALGYFKTLRLDGDLISRNNFPLPTLGPRLDDIRRDIHYGKGFGLIRGLDPQKYSTEDLSLLYLGIQSYIASHHGRQDRKGNMLVEGWASSSLYHVYQAGDIIGWLTRSAAAVGGKCIIASAYTVYNVLATSRSDLIGILARPDWPFALPHFKRRPVLFYDEGKLIINLSRVALTGSAAHQRPSDLPCVTPCQIEALDAVERIAKASQLEIGTQAGDIHFVNNLTILHRREEFTNGEALQEQRHLVRMRLWDDVLGWKLPEELREDWLAAFNEVAPRVWHLEPMPDGFFPLRSQPN